MPEIARPIPGLKAPLRMAAALGLATALGLAPAHAQPQNPAAPDGTAPGAPAATSPAPAKPHDAVKTPIPTGAPMPTAAPGPTAPPAPAATPTAPPAPAGTPAPAGKAEQPAGNDVVNDNSLVLACKQKALVLIKQRSPEVEDIFIDMDGLTVAQADTTVGDTKVVGVMMGEAYIQREKTDRMHRFLCLTGEGGKVLMTFFTER